MILNVCSFGLVHMSYVISIQSQYVGYFLDVKRGLWKHYPKQRVTLSVNVKEAKFKGFQI